MHGVSFFSDGARIAADLTLPDGDHGGDVPRPAVLICPGWDGRRTRHIARIGADLVSAGFAVLAFDFRGYGESEGRSGRLFPAEQVADIRAAAAFLRGHVRIDPARVCALGALTGASAALQAASEDPGIAAVVAFFPFGDGERWLRSLRSDPEWRNFRRRIDADRVTRSQTGRSEELRADEISREMRTRLQLNLDSADAIVSFKPEDQAYRIAPRPVMVVAVKEDLLVPFDEVVRLFARIREPKSMLVLPDIAHHDIYEERRLAGVVADIAKFLREALPGRSDGNG